MRSIGDHAHLTFLCQMCIVSLISASWICTHTIEMTNNPLIVLHLFHFLHISGTCSRSLMNLAVLTCICSYNSWSSTWINGYMLSTSDHVMMCLSPCILFLLCFYFCSFVKLAWAFFFFSHPSHVEPLLPLLSSNVTSSVACLLNE
jgi:hypothetical protein